MATVRDIARSVGVSPATVSRSLNQTGVVSKDIRDQVLAEAKRMGYPTKRKRSRPADTVAPPGMIGALFFNASSGMPYSGYDASVWGGVTRAAISLKYGVSVVDPQARESGESFRDFARRIGVAGLILRVDEGSRHRCEQIAEEGVPHVVIADRFDGDSINYVYCNSYDASYAAIEHLIGLGHTRIGVGHNHVLDTDHHDRLRAYRQALQDHGLEFDPQLVLPAAVDLRGGASAFNRLMSMPEPPTAMFFTDPQMTVTALRRSLEVGIRVPEELSIVGVDDDQLREMTFPVYTAVCQRAEQLGYEASLWLCRQVAGLSGGQGSHGPAAKLQRQVDAVLEVNQTTAPPPKAPGRISPAGNRLDTV